MKDTESIVAKAIRDGGIDAVIDHANGWMLSKEIANIYTTSEPAAAFHARTAFCLDIHNEVHFVVPPVLMRKTVLAWQSAALMTLSLHQRRDASEDPLCGVWSWASAGDASLLRRRLLQAVRAMRFDAGANRKKLETAESARERVIAEEELAKAMEDDDGL